MARAIRVIFNDEAPSRYEYKYFEVMMDNGTVETFHYHINNPIPTEKEMLGLTFKEIAALYRKKFYEAIGQKEPNYREEEPVSTVSCNKQCSDFVLGRCIAKKRDCITIPRKMYKDLREALAILEALEWAGVDNWEGYGYAMEEFRKGERE